MRTAEHRLHQSLKHLSQVGFWTGKSRSSDILKKGWETRRKNGYVHKVPTGAKSHFWKGGISFEEYPQEFNKELKLKIRERDNFTCQLCGKTEGEEKKTCGRILAVNHIDFDKKNCDESNLNTLCCSCNAKVNFHRAYYTEYFQQYQTCSP